MIHGYCDGSGNSPRGSTCACVLIDTETGEIVKERSQLLTKCSNNIAEYAGMALLLETALLHDITEMQAHSDSQLIVNQVNGEWEAKDGDLNVLRLKVLRLRAAFDHLKIVWVPREKNGYSDSLCTKLLNLSSPKDDSTPNPFPYQKSAFAPSAALE